MATVLRASGDRVCIQRRDWVRQLVAVVVALVLAAVLAGKDAEAQTLAGGAPTSGVSWSLGPGSTPGTASLSGNTMSAVAAFAVTATLFGVTQVWPVGRTVTVGASVMGAAGRAILQAAMSRGALSGAALAAALALAGDTTYDAASNSFLYGDSSKAYPSANGYFVDNTTGQFLVGASAAILGNVKAMCEAAFPGKGTYMASSGGYNGNGAVLTCISQGSNLMGVMRRVMPGCDSGSLVSGANCVPRGVPATNAQIEAAISAAPASWTGLYSAAGCPEKVNSYIDLGALSGNTDPCAMIVVGGSPSPVNVPSTNNPYGWPAQKWTEAANGVTHDKSLALSTAVAANTGADAKSNPVTVQTTATLTDTAKDAAGNTTTTTTTTTAPAETKPGDTKADEPVATFSAGDATLYTKKSRTFNDVLLSFQSSLSAAPWMVAAKGFFNVSIGSASCPHWTVAATKWTPVLDAGTYVCSSTMLALYAAGGAVVLAVAAWAAFRIAFL